MYYYFLEQEGLSISYEDFLKEVDGVQLGKFREDFWAEVVNFSDPLKKKILAEMWRDYLKEIKKASAQENSEPSS